MNDGVPKGQASNQDEVAKRSGTCWEQLKYPRPVHYDASSLLQKLLATWASPFLERGSKEGFKQEDAEPLLSYSDRLQPLVESYQNGYACEEEASKSRSRTNNTRNFFLYTLLRCNAPLMITQGLFILAVSTFRVLTAIGFQQYLQWLQSDGERGAEGGVWYGWMWAGLLVFFQMAQVLCEHRQDWCGSRLGYRWTQQAIAAAQEKLLRLSSATFRHVSTGTIINLVSNDVRRFEEFSLHWPYLWAAPVESVVCTVLIARAVGWVPAVVGMTALLLVIPIQAKLAGQIGALRQQLAQRTDERVRLSGEVVEGAANVKMLCWEAPFQKLLGRIRRNECKPLLKTQMIIASGAAVFVLCVPVACLVTFGTAVGMGQVLVLDNLFYVIALLNMPKVWMTGVFLFSVKEASETLVATSRFFRFLHEVEALVPAQNSPKELSNGSIEFRGASFSWGSGAWAGVPYTDTSSTKAIDTAAKFTPMEKFSSEAPVTTQNGVISDAEEAKACAAITLHAPTFKISPGEFVGVAGEVGSGKSSLLAAILGELQPIPQKNDYIPGQTPIEGAPVCKGRVAYCQQVPWIEAGSVRDNIIFGCKFESEWYAQVKSACALDHDVAQLPAADDTEIGERGINLSGGQKARLALARAAYSRPDIVLLDDPISSVDSKVAKVLFDECIGPEGILRKATRVLVTHQSQWLHACTRALVMRGGKIIIDSPWIPLQDSTNLPEHQLVTSVPYNYTHDVSDHDICDVSDNDSSASLNFNHAHVLDASFQSPESSPVSSRVYETCHGSSYLDNIGSITLHPDISAYDGSSFEDNPLYYGQNNGQNPLYHGKEPTEVNMDVFSAFVRDDTTPQAPVEAPIAVSESSFDLWLGVDGSSSTYYKTTCSDDKACGACITTHDYSAPSCEYATEGKLTIEEHRETGSLKRGVLLQYFSAIGIWKCLALLAALTGGQAALVTSEWWLTTWAQSSPDSQSEDIGKWIVVYSALVAVIIALALSRSTGWFYCAVSGSSSINLRMLHAVLRARLEFFHTTPTGRILNVLTKDQGAVDEQLPLIMFQTFQGLATLLTAIVLVPIANPMIAPIILPLAYIFGKVRQYHLASSREIKRFEAVTRSPVYAMFSETVKGLSTIRAFQVEGRFRKSFIEALDLNGSWKLAYQVTGRWLAARLDFAAICLLATAVFVATGAKSHISPALVALSLAHILQLFGMISFIVKVSAEAENNMTSVERMLVYTRLPQERAATVATGGAAPPPGWPKSATLEFDQVQARYRPGLPPVLKDISFSVPSGTTCGVVGRTGSGKSSLLLALYELIEITGGSVSLDGLDVSKVALSSLRQQIAVIPQDPLLFSGTLRSNLDPWRSKSDADMWEALRSVQLEAPVTILGGLDAHMAEAGGNFSAGQRQLLCLARALLSHARVLALDEATANVDRTTDATIQKTLRTAVKGSGACMERIMLVIAHRVDTVLDCDQLLVLADGNIVQSGHPKVLAEVPGVFSELVAAAGADKEAHMHDDS